MKKPHSSFRLLNGNISRIGIRPPLVELADVGDAIQSLSVWRGKAISTALPWGRLMHQNRTASDFE